MLLSVPRRPRDFDEPLVSTRAASSSSANAVTVGCRSPGCRDRPFITAASSAGGNLRLLASDNGVAFPLRSCWNNSRGLRPLRSEEHTSELQSRRDLVCRLLLEKKKKKEND